MKRILTLVAFFATVQASAQQVNPVPDYVFANRMSAGRNTVTDTAAYFSIGPRYGATRGMMPPMVVDTASFSANKRNGLLIFSVQKNKFLYWDSVGVKWAEMAGTGGSAITGSGVAGYMPEFTTTTNLDTTRLYHSAGRFAIGSTTTTNGVFNVYGGQSYFDTSLKVGSQTFLADEGKNEIYVNTSTDNGAFALQIGGGVYATSGGIFAASTGNVGIRNAPSAWASTTPALQILNGAMYGFGDTELSLTSNIFFDGSNFKTITTNAGSALSMYTGLLQFATTPSATAGSNVTQTVRMQIKNDGEMLLATVSDVGDYKLQIGGNIYASRIDINTSGQTLAYTTYYGANASGNNLYAGGGGFNSLGAVGETFKGSANTSFGSNAMLNVTTGYGNAAVGRSSMSATTTGYQNSSLGSNSLSANTTGYSNVAIGNAALLNNTTGYYNISIGQDAGSLINAGGNNVTSNNSIYIGYDARASASGNTNEIVIGSTARGAGDNTITFGNSSILNNYFTGNINTSAPTGGSIKPWRLGEAATVSPTSPNRTIRVEIDGTVYYIHAKTTND